MAVKRKILPPRGCSSLRTYRSASPELLLSPGVASVSQYAPNGVGGPLINKGGFSLGVMTGNDSTWFECHRQTSLRTEFWSRKYLCFRPEMGADGGRARRPYRVDNPDLDHRFLRFRNPSAG